MTEMIRNELEKGMREIRTKFFVQIAEILFKKTCTIVLVVLFFELMR